MIKKTTFALSVMLFMVAQSAVAENYPTSEEMEASNNKLTMIMLIWVGLAFLGYFIYRTFPIIKALFGVIRGGFRMDKKTTLSEEQQRKILLSGVYSKQKGTYMNSLRTGGNSWSDRDLLSTAYGIFDGDSAKAKLDYFKLAGSRRFFPFVVESLKLKDKQAIQQYLIQNLENEEDAIDCWGQVQNAFEAMPSMIKEGIIKDEADFARIGPDAWDSGRLVFVARLCLEQKYITEADVWYYVDAADDIAHQSLTSWEDYGKSYIIGRCLWCGTANYFAVMAGHAKEMFTDSKSPWQQIPFAK